MTTPTREDLELYVMGCYDGDTAALEAHLAEDVAARAIVAEEAGLEIALRDAAAAATFCPACDDVVRADRCDACGAAVRAGGYVIDRVLVQNAHGRMYLAHDVDGKSVALKELAFVQSPGAEALAAFEREARFLRALAHVAIPRFVASFQEGHGVHTRCYLAQDFIEGQALDARLADHWYDETEIKAIARQVLEVIAYLQALSPQIVHRDIKPANLVRRPAGTIALVDFGAAYAQGATIGSTAIGTFGYMPLEQMAGVVDGTTDPYALGASLLHLLTRREPWRWMQSPAWETVNVSPPMRDFLQKLVAPDPRERFASAADAIAALDRMDRGEPVVPVRVAAPRPRRPRWRTALVAASIAGVAASSAVGVYHIATDGDEPMRPEAAAPRGLPAKQPAPAVATVYDTIPAGKPIDLDFKDAPAPDVVRFLADACSVNAVLPDHIDFKVTLRLKQVPCDQALEVLLESRGLWYRYEKDGNLLRIDARKTLDAETEAAMRREPVSAALGRDDSLPAGREVDLDFKDAPIRAIVEILAAAGSVNIVVPDAIDGKVTVRVKQVAWNRALQAVLASQGLWYRYREKGKVVRVAPRRELDAEDEAELERRMPRRDGEPVIAGNMSCDDTIAAFLRLAACGRTSSSELDRIAEEVGRMAAADRSDEGLRACASKARAIEAKLRLLGCNK